MGGFRENGKFKKKSGRAMFLIFWTPNFIPNFRKIIAAVPEIIRDTRTHTRTDGRKYESDSISPAVCNLGPIKNIGH